MAVNKSDCIASARSAGATEIEAAHIVETLLRRKKELTAERKNVAAAQALSQLWGTDVRDLDRKALLNRRHAALSIIKRREAADFINAVQGQGFSFMDGLRALLVGSAKRFDGARNSVDARQKGIFQSWVGPMLNELENVADGHALRFIRDDKDFHDNVFREMRQPGSTKSTEARATADIFSRYTNQARLQKNAAGMDIPYLHGWTPQTHDAEKMLRGPKARQEWVSFVLERVDIARTFGKSAGDPAKTLDAMYVNLTTGRPFETFTPDADAQLNMPPNSADKEGHSRFIHFKDADAALAYNERYGKGNIFDAMTGSLRNDARKLSLLEKLGPNPQALIESLLAAEKQRLMLNPNLPVAEREKSIQTLDAAWGKGIIRSGKAVNWLAELTGESAVPLNPTAARWGGVLRATQSLSKLGAASLSAVADVFIKAGSMRVNGLTWPESMSRSITQYFHTYPKDRREAARQCGAFIDCMLGEINARWDAADDVRHSLSGLQDKLFKYSGLNWITERGKAGYTLWLSQHLGEVREKPFARLDADRRAMLRYHGIDAEKWEVLRRMTETAEDGRVLFVPGQAHALPEESLVRLLPEHLRDYGWYGEKIKEWRTTRRRLRGEHKRASDADAAALRTYNKKRAESFRIHDLRQWEESRAAAEAKLKKQNPFTQTQRITVGDKTGIISNKAEYEKFICDSLPDTLRTKAARDTAKAELRKKYPYSIKKPQRITVGDKTGVIFTKQEYDIFIRNSLPEHLRKRPVFNATEMPPRHFELPPRPDIPGPSEWAAMRTQEIERVRTGLHIDAMSMLADETSFAIIEPDAAARALMRQGTRPGTAAGEFWRMIMQFKSFPFAYMQRVMGGRRWVRGGRQEGMAYGFSKASLTDAVTRDISGLTGFALSSLAFGYIAMTLKDVSKGKKPRDPRKLETVMAAALQSGGAGIFGDFFFAKASRYGSDFASALVGPVPGAVGGFVPVVSTAMRGELREAGETALQAGLNNVPFINLWYTRAAMEWAFLYHLREGMSPGALTRMERKMKKEFGQEFLVSPSRNIKRGGFGFR